MGERFAKGLVMDVQFRGKNGFYNFYEAFNLNVNEFWPLVNAFYSDPDKDLQPLANWLDTLPGVKKGSESTAVAFQNWLYFEEKAHKWDWTYA